MKRALKVRERFFQVAFLSGVESVALLRLRKLAGCVQIHATHTLYEPDELIDARTRHVVRARAHVVVAHHAGQMHTAKLVGHGCEQMVQRQPLFPKLNLVRLEVVSNAVDPGTMFPQVTLAGLLFCAELIDAYSNGFEIGARATSP